MSSKAINVQPGENTAKGQRSDAVFSITDGSHAITKEGIESAGNYALDYIFQKHSDRWDPKDAFYMRNESVSHPAIEDYRNGYISLRDESLGSEHVFDVKTHETFKGESVGWFRSYKTLDGLGQVITDLVSRMPSADTGRGIDWLRATIRRNEEMSATNPATGIDASTVITEIRQSVARVKERSTPGPTRMDGATVGGPLMTRTNRNPVDLTRGASSGMTPQPKITILTRGPKGEKKQVSRGGLYTVAVQNGSGKLLESNTNLSKEDMVRKIESLLQLDRVLSISKNTITAFLQPPDYLRYPRQNIVSMESGLTAEFAEHSQNLRIEEMSAKTGGGLEWSHHGQKYKDLKMKLENRLSSLEDQDGSLDTWYMRISSMKDEKAPLVVLSSEIGFNLTGKGKTGWNKIHYPSGERMKKMRPLKDEMDSKGVKHFLPFADQLRTDNRSSEHGGQASRDTLTGNGSSGQRQSQDRMIRMGNSRQGLGSLGESFQGQSTSTNWADLDEEDPNTFDPYPDSLASGQTVTWAHEKQPVETDHAQDQQTVEPDETHGFISDQGEAPGIPDLYPTPIAMTKHRQSVLDAMARYGIHSVLDTILVVPAQ